MVNTVENLINESWFIINEKYTKILLARNSLMSLRSTSAKLAVDVTIQAEILDYINIGMSTLIIWNKKMKNRKIVKFLKESGLLIRNASRTIKNEIKNKSMDF